MTVVTSSGFLTGRLSLHLIEVLKKTLEPGMERDRDQDWIQLASRAGTGLLLLN